MIKKRIFNYITEAELKTLLSRAKQKKYEITEYWFEVTEITGQSGISSKVSSFSSYKNYYNTILYYEHKLHKCSKRL